MVGADWFVVELADGKRVRGRHFLQEHVQSGIYPYRVELFWNKSDDTNYDEDMTAKIEEQLRAGMERDRMAFLISVTEDDSQYIFTWYVQNEEEFGERLNKILAFFPPLPISVFSTEDIEWTAYKEIEKMIEN